MDVDTLLSNENNSKLEEYHSIVLPQLWILSNIYTLDGTNRIILYPILTEVYRHFHLKMMVIQMLAEADVAKIKEGQVL